MTFEEQGFLSDETHEIRKITRNSFSNIFDICQEISVIANRIRNSIKLDYENELHIVSICLLQRILDSYQSTVILMETGLEADSNTIIRSSIEALFILRKLSLDPHYIKKYLGSDQIQRKKLINVAKHEEKSILRKTFTEQELEEKLSEILTDIEQYRLKDICIEQLAREVGLDDWYQLTYRVLSTDAHSLPRSLERYLEFDEEQNIVKFNFNPKTDGLNAVLITHSSILLIALDSIEKIFNCGFSKQIDALHKTIMTL